MATFQHINTTSSAPQQLPSTACSPVAKQQELLMLKPNNSSALQQQQQQQQLSCDSLPIEIICHILSYLELKLDWVMKDHDANNVPEMRSSIMKLLYGYKRDDHSSGDRHALLFSSISAPVDLRIAKLWPIISLHFESFKEMCSRLNTEWWRMDFIFHRQLHCLYFRDVKLSFDIMRGELTGLRTLTIVDCWIDERGLGNLLGHAKNLLHLNLINNPDLSATAVSKHISQHSCLQSLKFSPFYSRRDSIQLDKLLQCTTLKRIDLMHSTIGKISSFSALPPTHYHPHQSHVMQQPQQPTLYMQEYERYLPLFHRIHDEEVASSSHDHNYHLHQHHYGGAATRTTTAAAVDDSTATSHYHHYNHQPHCPYYNQLCGSSSSSSSNNASTTNNIYNNLESFKCTGAFECPTDVYFLSKYKKLHTLVVDAEFTPSFILVQLLRELPNLREFQCFMGSNVNVDSAMQHVQPGLDQQDVQVHGDMYIDDDIMNNDEHHHHHHNHYEPMQHNDNGTTTSTTSDAGGDELAIYCEYCSTAATPPPSTSHGRSSMFAANTRSHHNARSSAAAAASVNLTNTSMGREAVMRAVQEYRRIPSVRDNNNNNNNNSNAAGAIETFSLETIGAHSGNMLLWCYHLNFIKTLYVDGSSGVAFSDQDFKVLLLNNHVIERFEMRTSRASMNHTGSSSSSSSSSTSFRNSNPGSMNSGSGISGSVYMTYLSLYYLGTLNKSMKHMKLRYMKELSGGSANNNNNLPTATATDHHDNERMDTVMIDLLASMTTPTTATTTVPTSDSLNNACIKSLEQHPALETLKLYDCMMTSSERVELLLQSTSKNLQNLKIDDSFHYNEKIDQALDRHLTLKALKMPQATIPSHLVMRLFSKPRLQQLHLPSIIISEFDVNSLPINETLLELYIGQNSRGIDPVLLMNLKERCKALNMAPWFEHKYAYYEKVL